MIREAAWRALARVLFAIGDAWIWAGDRANRRASAAAARRLRK